MGDSALTGPYVRTFALICPSLPATPAVEWPEIPAEALATFLRDCTMAPSEFKQTYGARLNMGDDLVYRWRELVHISLTVTTPSGFVLQGKICPERSTQMHDGSWELSANVRQTEDGLRILDAEISLEAEVDGLRMSHLSRHVRDPLTIRQDGTIVLP